MSIGGRKPVAAMELGGAYTLRLRIGEVEVISDPRTFTRFCISQSINRYLPSLRLTVPSTSDHYVHLVPFDQTLKIRVDINIISELEQGGNGFDFLVYRRFPESRISNFDVEALANIYDVIEHKHTRGFDGTVYETVEQIASEFQLKHSPFESVDQKQVDLHISPTLSYQKNIVQTDQTNAQLLTQLKNTLVGANGEGPYYCFLAYKDGRVGFYFQPLNELASLPPKYYFCYGGEAVLKEYESSEIEITQVWDFEIIDNYMLAGVEGLKQHQISYFNFDTGEFSLDAKDPSEFYSLSKNLAIRKSDENVYSPQNFGRSNEFHEKFERPGTATYYRRLMTLSRIAITSFGKHNAVPGDIVQLYFTEPAVPDDVHNFQYQGRWMIERVDHQIGEQFSTTFMLMRPGLDAEKSTDLVEATQGPYSGK